MDSFLELQENLDARLARCLAVGKWPIFPPKTFRYNPVQMISLSVFNRFSDNRTRPLDDPLKCSVLTFIGERPVGMFRSWIVLYAFHDNLKTRYTVWIRPY